jgi:cardiolipin hydrolase
MEANTPTTTTNTASTSSSVNLTLFFPDPTPFNYCVRTLIRYLESAQKTMEICMYSITDDRISEVIVKAHKRGVRVRIITDDDQSVRLGSDIERMREEGIPVKMDLSPGYHMHHKFTLIDGKLLMNGSANFSRSANNQNHENIMITDNREFVQQFNAHFERMWADNNNFR